MPAGHQWSVSDVGTDLQDAGAGSAGCRSEDPAGLLAAVLELS